LQQASLTRAADSAFELLRWAVKIIPSSNLKIYRESLSKIVCSREAMKWLYQNYEICPLFLDWAFEVGDLEAIQWVAKKFPSKHRVKKYINAAAKRDHLHVFEWVWKEYSMYLSVASVLKTAVESGNLKIATYLIMNFVPEKTVEVQIGSNVRADQYLNTLKWTLEHGISFDPSYEMTQAASKGHLQVYLWLTETFPNIKPLPEVWEAAAENGHYKIYKQLLERYPEGRQPNKIYWDISNAYLNGHLEIVTMLLENNPAFISDLSGLGISKLNYHVERWLNAAGKKLAKTIVDN
jgi:hypothetical protein